MNIWEKLNHFNVNENWGKPEKMDNKLLIILDAFREHIDSPIIVTCGNQGKHSAKSYHYVENGSCAVDIVLPYYNETLFDLFVAITRFNFKGVGFYPGWQYRGKKAIGLHLDTRQKLVGSRWFQPLGSKEYLPLSLQSLEQHGLSVSQRYHDI